MKGEEAVGEVGSGKGQESRKRDGRVDGESVDRSDQEQIMEEREVGK